MAVNLVSFRLYDEVTGTPGGGVDYLKGNVGEKVRAELDFEVAWNSGSHSFSFSAGSRTITRSDTGGSFITDGFKIGDTIAFEGTAINTANKTVTGITATTLVISEPISDEVVTCTIHGITPVKAIDYYYNLIENNAGENYTSLTDTDVKQKLIFSNLNTSVTGTTSAFIIGTDSKAWVNGSAYITTHSFNAYKQRMKIVHSFYITPFFLAGQLNNIQNIESPDLFIGEKSLKYNCKIDARLGNYNPTPAHTSDFSFNENYGNTGWFNEVFNKSVDPIYLSLIHI